MRGRANIVGLGKSGIVARFPTEERDFFSEASTTLLLHPKTGVNEYQEMFSWR